MSFHLRGISIKFNEQFSTGLAKVFGIGVEKGSYLGSMLGFGRKFRANLLNYSKWEVICFLIKRDYNVGNRLRTIIKWKVKGNLLLKVIKGIRFYYGLPVRGQRTHSNGKQLKHHKRNQI